MEHELERAIRDFGDHRRYKPATVERWLRLADADAAALLELALALRLGENQLRDLWNWAEEIAARDALPLAAVLASEEVVAALRRPLGRNDKLELIKACLRARRFPELTRAEQRLAALVRSLGLPRQVRVSWPPFLEGEELRIEIVARNPDELGEAAKALLTASSAAACAEIFAQLGGGE